MAIQRPASKMKEPGLDGAGLMTRAAPWGAG